jgi:outer membrane protein W
MKVFALFAALFLIAAPSLFAGNKGDKSVIVAGEWVWRTGQSTTSGPIESGTTLAASLTSGPGLVFGFNYFVGNKVSVELTAGAARMRGRAISRQGDSVQVLMLGHVNVYPVTAVAQYHFMHQGRVGAYVGAGASYVMFSQFQQHPNGVGKLHSDRGAVVNGGIEWEISRRLDFIADAKYVPFETGSGFTSNDRGFKFKPVFGAVGIRYKF